MKDLDEIMNLLLNCSNFADTDNDRAQPSNNSINENSTVLIEMDKDYDHEGAIWYVIAVLLVYSFSIFLFIMSMIKKTRSQEEIDSYLSDMGTIREQEKRQEKHKTWVFLHNNSAHKFTFPMPEPKCMHYYSPTGATTLFSPLRQHVGAVVRQAGTAINSNQQAQQPVVQQPDHQMSSQLTPSVSGVSSGLFVTSAGLSPGVLSLAPEAALQAQLQTALCIVSPEN